MTMRSGSVGALDARTDACGLAAMIDATLHGLSLRARDGVGRDHLDRAVDALMRAWDSHAPMVPAGPVGAVPAGTRT